MRVTHSTLGSFSYSWIPSASRGRANIPIFRREGPTVWCRESGPMAASHVEVVAPPAVITRHPFSTVSAMHLLCFPVLGGPLGYRFPRTGAGSGPLCSAAQRKPANSRAMATATLGAGFRWYVSAVNRRQSRCWGLVGDSDDPRGLARAAPPQRGADVRIMPIVPGRFDEDAAEVVIAHLGDPAVADSVAGAGLAGDHAQKAHARARGESVGCHRAQRR